jgi:diguanylate cyclase (GGDEF)-like protein
MLKSVARLLKSCCRGTDACARLGGDEFAVILPHAGSAVAGVVRDRILKEMVRAPVPVDGQQLSLSLSIGVASLAETRNALELVAEADADMYRVKEASRAEPALASRPR